MLEIIEEDGLGSFVYSFLPALLTTFIIFNVITFWCAWVQSLRPPPKPRWVLPSDVKEVEFETEDGKMLVGWTKGDGPDIILLHGGGGLSSNFHFVFKRLVTKGFRVTAFDLRSHGQSSTAKDLSPKILSSDLALVLDTIDARNAILVGYDLGGYSALALCAFHPTVIATRVKGLVLLSSYTVRPQGNFLAALLSFIVTSGLAHALCRSRWFANSWSRPLFGRVTNKTMQEEWRRMFLANPPRTTALAVKASDENLSPLLNGVRIPALVVCGEGDMLRRHQQQSLCDALAVSRMVWLKQMGHLLPWEAPDKLISLLTEFSSSLHPSAALELQD